jgi:hypothetical protein
MVENLLLKIKDCKDADLMICARGAESISSERWSITKDLRDCKQWEMIAKLVGIVFLK